MSNNGQVLQTRKSTDKQSVSNSPERASVAMNNSTVNGVLLMKNRRLVDTTAAWQALISGHEDVNDVRRKSINAIIKQENVKLEL